MALIEADGGRAAFHPADVKNENEINGLMAFAESTFGGLDILVNNASKPDTMGLLSGWMDAMAVEILAPMRKHPRQLPGSRVDCLARPQGILGEPHARATS